ncbi:major facilitator transporter [Rhodococcus opacus M213]|uniref:Major facilitator transporter n=1 Tax=Rhodococcus opacus M213 TaxID=1129896 RepID=K8XIN7_RHOOP|nr:major facilitator transporter [Rhodococcus opacus M213]
MIAISLGRAVMAALIDTSPVHLVEHGASLTVVGVTISLDIAGMYAFSPVFGIAAGKLGNRTVLLADQGALAMALLSAALGRPAMLR